MKKKTKARAPKSAKHRKGGGEARQVAAKAGGRESPARAGDCLELFAEIDLLGALSACPGGDCSAEHSSDVAVCHPLRVEILRPAAGALDGWSSPAPNGYDRSHGV